MPLCHWPCSCYPNHAQRQADDWISEIYEKWTAAHAAIIFTPVFEDGPGNNPEELIGAAHAGCFTMALSTQLGEAGMTADSLKTIATVTLDKVEGGFSTSAVHLDLVEKILGASQDAFETVAENAKRNCPVSNLLKTKITLDAKLEN